MRGYSSTPEDYLFHKGDWFATQDAWKKKLVASIEAMNGDELLNTSTVDLAKYYVSEYELEVPTIYPDDIVVDQRETQIDISQDRNRLIHDRSRPYHIAGTSVDVDCLTQEAKSVSTFNRLLETSTIPAHTLATTC